VVHKITVPVEPVVMVLLVVVVEAAVLEQPEALAEMVVMASR
jgi:hypothetical protein